MSRKIIGVLTAALSISWFAGFLSYVAAHEQYAAERTAQYVYAGRLQSRGDESSAVRCMRERDASTKHALDHIQWPKTLLMAGKRSSFPIFQSA
jgi:hypothetical protein